MLRHALVAVLLAACSGGDGRSAREQRVIDTLAADNRLYAERDRELYELKLAKMQRSVYDWMRGTAAVYWRDVNDGVYPTAFEAPAVLLVGDPHPENLGTFRASDGTMVVDWNDLDSAGYGPFTADVRRLAVGLILATDGSDSDDAQLAEAVARGYAAQAGLPGTFVLGAGMNALIDAELERSEDDGDLRDALAELAPVSGTVRVPVIGDIEEAGKDGVYEDTTRAIDAAEAARIDAAIAPAVAKVRVRRIGAGVASYAALRYNVVLEGPTAALDDDIVIELKEERDSEVPGGAPDQHRPEWVSPAARVIDAQRRLQARTDEDPLLARADVSGLSLKIRDREAYQRGLARASIDDLKRSDQRDLAGLLGRRLASAHGAAVAPVLAGRTDDFAAEISESARAEADQIRDDYDDFDGEDDLAAVVLP